MIWLLSGKEVIKYDRYLLKIIYHGSKIVI